LSKKSPATKKINGPTQHDVARLAGVSIATVSRVLNAPMSVNENRRKAVQQAMTELEYVPNLAGQMLVSRRSRIIGSVFPRLNTILFGQFFTEIQYQLDDRGYMFSLTSYNYRLENETERLRQLIARGAEGLILVGCSQSDEALALIEKSGVACLRTWTWREQSSLPQIGFCNTSAMARIAEHIADLGHRNIAYISGHLKDNDRARDRLQGVREVLNRRGLALADNHIIETSFGIDEGAHAFVTLVSKSNPPTAIICGSDIFAFGALREANRMGISVPGDVSVTGFDDTEFSEICMPSLTTVRTPRQLMAERCAQVLVENLENGEPIPSMKLPTELIVRNSTAQPKN